ncbi:MAG TPA: glucose-6-phosphate isomerase [Burkholderiaceae bacterium]|nr:glucose-6-phosphate isomerase [Burkholderiaceae bacterium]
MADTLLLAPSLTQSAEWQALRDHRKALGNFSMRHAFANEPDRFARYSRRVQDGGLDMLLDYSKHRIDARTLPLLIALANERGLPERIERMFAGERINETEDRAVLHVALRDLSNRRYEVDGVDVAPEISEVRERFLAFAEHVRGGAWRGHTGESITDVVNLGIGGSDLGPQMVVEALKPYHDGPRVHFVSNVDGAHLGAVLRELDPQRTLFVIASKTFTTIETMTNAHTARRWLIDALGDEAAIARHAVAVSTNAQAVASFGIAPENMFGFWDWVGGRYSLWSSVGVSIALAIGRTRFLELLAGAHAMDTHFRSTPCERNLPVILGLLGVWYVNFWDAASHTIAPYYQHLSRFVAHIQQVDMESNGKRVTLDGAKVDYATGPVIWGEPGTNGQHAYFQLLHQGPALIPVDFLVAAESPYPYDEHHRILVANCFAQSSALLHGKTADEARADMLAAGMSEDEADRLALHREFPGNRPSSTLLVHRFDPRTIGALTALYEHKVFVQGVVWGVNSFDQWGVELGKKIATRLGHALDGDTSGEDASTAGLIRTLRAMRGDDAATSDAQVGG